VSAGKTAASARKSRRAPSKAEGGHKSQPISPEQALANTRALLEAKLERAHQPPPYPTDDPVHHHGKPGPMSDGASAALHDRHLGEINNAAIHGHVAAQVRGDQVKRDKR
jgi:hypothetical protein